MEHGLCVDIMHRRTAQHVHNRPVSSGGLSLLAAPRGLKALHCTLGTSVGTLSIFSPAFFAFAFSFCFAPDVVWHVRAHCERVWACARARGPTRARLSVQLWFRRRPFFSSRSESEPDSTEGALRAIRSIGDFRGACKRTENGNCMESI